MRRDNPAGNPIASANRIWTRPRVLTFNFRRLAMRFSNRRQFRLSSFSHNDFIFNCAFLPTYSYICRHTLVLSRLTCVLGGILVVVERISLAFPPFSGMDGCFLLKIFEASTTQEK